MLLAASSLFTVSCATQVTQRDPASLREIEGRSIPENSLTRTKSVSFAIKENGVKLAESSSTTYEAPAAKYSAEIDGIFSGAILSATGEYVVEFKDGDDAITHKRVGKTKYKNIVLRKAYDGKSELQEWYKKSLAGSVERKSGSVILTGHDDEEIRINFSNARPVKWTGPALNARSGEQAIEELEISFEGLEIK